MKNNTSKIELFRVMMTKAFASKVQKNRFLISLLLLAVTSFYAQLTFAWSGYDYENKSEIDIGPGNLVREGLTIQFYDVREDDYHTAKVVLMENTASGVRMTIQDLDAKKERIFIMQE